MTPNQQAQKDRARAEAEKHLDHSAVDRMREANMMEGMRRDAVVNRKDEMTKKGVRDANNAYAGED
jgi:hypothetical protein